MTASPCILPPLRVPDLNILQLASRMSVLRTACEGPSLHHTLHASVVTLKELLQDVRGFVKDPAAVKLQLQLLRCLVRVEDHVEDVANRLLGVTSSGVV
jgi:hypothetical protein